MTMQLKDPLKWTMPLLKSQSKFEKWMKNKQLSIDNHYQTDLEKYIKLLIF